MGILGPVFFLPVNLCAAFMVAPLGLPSSTRPSMVGNNFVGLVAVFAGVPGFLMACAGWTYAFAGSYRAAALAYLASFVALVAAIAFAVHSRKSWRTRDVEGE